MSILEPSNLTMRPPEGDIIPLRANILEFSRVINATLLPLFPYMHKGAIVPCAAIVVGGDGRDWRMFKHFNSVDEVFTCFGSNGAYVKAGQIMLGAQEHFVNMNMEDNGNPSNYAIMSIVQRQWEKEAPQSEKVTIICEQCQEPLLVHAYDAHPTQKEAHEAAAADTSCPFPTPIHSAFAAQQSNLDAETLVCQECGFENTVFPLNDWGWHRYAEQAASSVKAAANLQQAFGLAKQVDRSEA